MGDAVAVEFDIAHSTDWHGRVFGFERGHRTFIDTLQADFQILQRPGCIDPLSRRGAVRDPDGTPINILHHPDKA